MAITNAERFKTAEERTIAFRKTCNGNCEDCKVFEVKNYRHNLNCPFLWLEIEADEEVPHSCPFCGSEARIRHNIHDDGCLHDYYIECGNPNCQISPKTNFYKTWYEAIAAWNKRV